MTEMTDTDGPPDDRSETPAGRPWHPPQFILTDLAATDVQANGGLDGGGMGSQS